ncbi:MAG: hypothetical protein PHE48_02580 [Candidatus Daviesbacteria bacterium]|nr:hypothetical protein [Candidatus Daviesbacteria bacterium]
MVKTLFATATMFILTLLLTTVVYAANLSVRIEVPKTPTNQNAFKINFVTMDILGRSVDVQCFKKGPGDSSSSQFGSTLNLSAGGNSGNCEVTSSIVSAEGTYEFYVIATAGSDTATSSTVNVEYKTSAPSTPGNYNKELLGSCQYKITFKTADDGGRTSRVEVYRSDQTSFTADSGTRVGTVWIGSNLEGSFIDNVPDCGKGYYYVIRAFDGAGNGSGIAGDSVTKVTITSTTTTTTQTSPAPTAAAGAILAVTSQVGQGDILGVNGEEATSEGDILGEGTPSSEEAGPSETVTPEKKLLTPKNIFLATLVLIILGGGYYYYRSRQK